MNSCDPKFAIEDGPELSIKSLRLSLISLDFDAVVAVLTSRPSATTEISASRVEDQRRAKIAAVQVAAHASAGAAATFNAPRSRPKDSRRHGAVPRMQVYGSNNIVARNQTLFNATCSVLIHVQHIVEDLQVRLHALALSRAYVNLMITLTQVSDRHHVNPDLAPWRAIAGPCLRGLIYITAAPSSVAIVFGRQWEHAKDIPQC